MRNKKVIFRLLCCLLVVCSNDRLFAQEGTLTPVAFEAYLSANKPQLLDVRTAAEYQTGHLKNALQADWLNKEQFADRVKYLDKEKPLLVYCASGARSAQAARWLIENGFVNVQNMKGGLTSWKLEGRSVDAAAPVTQMTTDAYRAIVNTAETVLVDFGAAWCPPCRKMDPVLVQLQAELKDQFKLVKIDGGIHTDVMKLLQVDGIPFFIIYKKGRETWRRQGVVTFNELKSKLME